MLTLPNEYTTFTFTWLVWLVRRGRGMLMSSPTGGEGTVKFGPECSVVVSGQLEAEVLFSVVKQKFLKPKGDGPLRGLSTFLYPWKFKKKKHI